MFARKGSEYRETTVGRRDNRLRDLAMGAIQFEPANAVLQFERDVFSTPLPRQRRGSARSRDRSTATSVDSIALHGTGGRRRRTLNAAVGTCQAEEGGKDQSHHAHEASVNVCMFMHRVGVAGGAALDLLHDLGCDFAERLRRGLLGMR